MKKNKLIEGMDHELWRKFTSKCRYDGVKVTERLTEMIKHNLEVQK